MLLEPKSGCQPISEVAWQSGWGRWWGGGGGGGGGGGLVFRAVVSLAFECLGLKGLLNVEVPCAFVDNPEILSSGV